MFDGVCFIYLFTEINPIRTVQGVYVGYINTGVNCTNVSTLLAHHQGIKFVVPWRVGTNIQSPSKIPHDVSTESTSLCDCQVDCMLKVFSIC